MHNFIYRLQILAIFLVFSFLAKSQSFKQPKILLSESSYISVLTCAPGNQLYSSFGHSAIGVFDTQKHIAIVFNYGTFSFNTPNFYLKFASGKLNYKLSISPYKRFIQSYKYEGRKVTEDILNLDLEQRQKLLDALLENYLPENREYQYDFFFDNCATRILDKVEETLPESIVFKPNSEITGTKTFRNLLDEYLQLGSWSDIGIDIVLGAIIDNPATEKQKTFLPDYLSIYIQNCYFNDKPLVKESRIISTDKTNFKPLPFFLRAPVIFITLFVAIVVFSMVFRKRNWVIADRIIFSTFGFIGVIVLLMMFATDHDAAANNLNFLWANPFYLIFAWYLQGLNNKVEKYGSVIFLAISILVLLFWSIIPQSYNVYFLPLIGIAITRLVFIALPNWVRVSRNS